MYLRILFCCSIVQVEIEAHHWECKVTEHISTKSPIFGSLSLSESVCSLYLSISPLLSLSLLHTSAAVSFLFIHSTSHEQTAPWMPWPEIRWNSHNSLPDYKISGFSIWTRWLRASIYQCGEVWSHSEIENMDREGSEGERKPSSYTLFRVLNTTGTAYCLFCGVLTWCDAYLLAVTHKIYQTFPVLKDHKLHKPVISTF